MTPIWTLITVTYNNAQTLEKYWADDRPSSVEWIVVDNGSLDESVETARSLGATVIEMGHNVGFSAANNAGLAQAHGAFIGFINPDVRVEYSDLDALAARIDEHGGIVGPQLRNDDGSAQPNGRGMPLLFHKIRNRITSGSELNDSYLLYAKDDEERTVFWLIGAAVTGRAETFALIDGWNEHFFLYYEDKDLSIRAWRAGLPVTLCGQFRWTHGWARETKTFRLAPWRREIASLLKFYALYPEFILGGRTARSRNRNASTLAGNVKPVEQD